jgi:hypothetical protein
MLSNFTSSPPISCVTYPSSRATDPIIMSSPTAPAADEVNDNPIVDEEMTNAVDAPTEQLVNGTGTQDQMDHEVEPQAQSSAAAHHNRKDATLREFLGKMDEFAPIVRGFLFLPVICSCSHHFLLTIAID